MTLADIVVIAVIVLVVGAATLYIIKAKKSGKKCIGCPDGCCCSKSQSCKCSCGNSAEDNKMQ